MSKVEVCFVSFPFTRSSLKQTCPIPSYLNHFTNTLTNKSPSLSGTAKRLEDTEKYARLCLPLESDLINHDPEKPKKPEIYRIAYAVHELLPPTNNTANSSIAETAPSRFIGQVAIRSLGQPNDLILPDAYVDPSTKDANVLNTELGYQLLPRAWGKGYATEMLGAVFDAFKRADPSYWAPQKKVYLRSIVNEGNPNSSRVMNKVGMHDFGVWEWTGPELFLAGEWITKSRICIYGKYLVE